jgi:glycosyltransferase involved in cell wall biosynthesis
MSMLTKLKVAATQHHVALKVLRARRSSRDRPHVFYGHLGMPGPDDLATGGIVKFQRLFEEYPNEPNSFNVLYLGSSNLPRASGTLLRAARVRGARIVWNQNGVAYPGWHGPGWERLNRPMRRGIHAADYVFYQSEFCRLGADRYLGPRSGPGEVLYNAVDTSVFTPGEARSGGRGLVLLLGGSQYQSYRVETAIRTLASVISGGLDAELVVTGRLMWLPDEREARRAVVSLARELGVEDRLGLMGAYSQRDAPRVLRRADVLLHTKYNDPCPSLVIEAMSCGLPVVYSASGGVPELVGDDAGVGVPALLDWEQDHPPGPAQLAAAVQLVATRLADHRQAARQRAVERFDVAHWRERHRMVFERLLA